MRPDCTYILNGKKMTHDEFRKAVIEDSDLVKKYSLSKMNVPNMPFSKTWHEMALRRVVQMAANQGYDAVAWTTGETQNDRYDLSKQVDEVAWERESEGKYGISVFKDGDLVQEFENKTPSELEDIIGKDATTKIVESKGEKLNGKTVGSLTGVDLKISGEGMKGFYDKILKNYAEKFGKKYGSKVGLRQIGDNRLSIDEIQEMLSDFNKYPTGSAERAALRLQQESAPDYGHDEFKGNVWAMPITPEMRDAASAGLEMFSRAGAALSPNSAQTKREIEAAINQRLRELGFPSAKYQLFDDVKNTNLPSADAVDADIEGAYYRGLIYISLNAPDPLSTLNHEAIHALKDAGAFTPAEWAALELNAAKWRKKYDIDKNYGDLGLSESRLNEEAIAHAFQDHTVKGIVRRIINKTVRFIKALGDILRGKDLNFKTADDVFNAVLEGKIGQRIEVEIAAQNAPIRQPQGELAFPMYKLSKAPKASLEQAMENLAEQNSAMVEGLERTLTRDVGGIAATILHPQQIATIHKPFTKVYLAVIERFKMREVLINQLSQPIALYNKLKPQTRKSVDAVLEIGRLDGKTYAPDASGKIIVKNEGLKNTLHSKDGQTITLTPHQTQAYLGVRKTMDLALDKIIDTILEEHGLLEKGVKTIQDVEKLRLEAIKNKDIIAAASYKDILTRLYEVADAKKRGYVPFKRWGEIGVSVKNEDGELVHFERLELPWKLFGNKGAIGDKPAVADALTRLQEKYGDDYQISFFEMNKFDDVAANIDIAQLDILAAGAGINEADYQRLREALRKEAQKKGFRAHFFRSKDIPGYSDDFERAINDYVVTASAYISRRLNERKIDEAVASISATGKSKLYEYARRYQEYVNNPDEELAIIRSAAFYTYLAGNFSSGIINLTQPYIVTAPWFKGQFSHAQIAKQMSKATYDATRIMRLKTARSELFDFDKAPADIRDALKKAQAEGDFLAMGTNDAMAISGTSSKLLRGFAKNRRAVGEAIALTFSVPERFNRVVTFTAAYRFGLDPKNKDDIMKFVANDQLAQAMLDGKTGKDFAFAYAEFAVVSTQYRVGKMNRPEIMRSWGSLIFQFWSYLTQTLELMYKLRKVNGNKSNQALFMILLSIIALSGLKGFPFEDDLQSLFEALYKFRTGKDKDIDTIVRDYLDRTTNPFIAETILKGLPASVLNVDISGRVGFGNVMPDQGTDFLGAWYNMAVERPMLFAEAINKGNEYQAISEIMPTFIGNAMKSFKWADDGVRTQNGIKVIESDDVTTTDASLKFIGFTSADISRLRDGAYAESRASQAVDELRSRYYDRLAKAVAEQTRRYEVGDDAGAKEMQELIDVILEEKDSHNASAEIKEQIILQKYTLKLKVRQELEGAEARPVRKQARPAVDRIREIYDRLD